MKRLTILMLLLSSTNVLAEWTYAGAATSNDYTIYVDLNTIRKKNNKAKMWYLWDFKNVKHDASNRSYFSLRSIDEFDCIDMNYKTLSFSLISGHMGTGSIVFSDDGKDDSAQEIAPGSTAEGLLEIACGK